MVTIYTSELPLGLAQAVSELPHKVYLYLEYTNSSGNVPDYSAANLIPNFSNPKSYYEGLTNANFLRVPAIKDPNVVTSVAGTTYTSTVTFFAQSTGATLGVIAGGPSLGNSSICYGAALVLVLDEADRTKDIVLARAYFTGAQEYITKTSSSQLFVTFPFTVNVTQPT